MAKKIYRDVPFEEIYAQLIAQANPVNVAGMRRFGIRPAKLLGVSVATLREMAKGIRSHRLAADLWATGVHEARILAGLVEDPAQITREQMAAWVEGFDSWDLCDQMCMKLFPLAPFAAEFIPLWAERPQEFVRRAGFVLIVGLAFHAPQVPDADFTPWFDLMIRHATDSRIYVRKAISWALRQAAKSRPALAPQAIATARAIGQIDAPCARWIAQDVLTEFEQKGILEQ